MCGVHPEGVDTEKCLDFRLNSEVKECEPWSPKGYSFYDGELVKNPSRYTQAEQLDILDNRPYFTGVCPNCNHQFYPDNPPIVHVVLKTVTKYYCIYTSIFCNTTVSGE